MKVAVRPLRFGPRWRTRSPPGGSTLITSAPWSASIMVPSGPEIIEVVSRMRMPSSGPGMGGSPSGSVAEAAARDASGRTI
jgi:hypothetical protein